MSHKKAKKKKQKKNKSKSKKRFVGLTEKYLKIEEY